MTDSNYEAISAFLDDEPFDPNALADALSAPGGRAFLLDIISLRRLAQPNETVPAMAPIPAPARSRWRVFTAAAALAIAVAGGYIAGERRASANESQPAAPAPTRVVEAVPFTPTGGGQ